MTRPGALRRLVPALDVPVLAEATRLAERLRDEVDLVKVGLELFLAEGPEAVRTVRALGLAVFLDVKLHDIPNTVGAAAREAGRLGVTMLTVHASGGAAMIAAAVKGAADGAREAGVPAPVVLGVTVLTSLDDAALEAVGLAGPSEAAVRRLGRLAIGAGAGGLVCSPAEVRALREELGTEPVLVTPGIRPAGAAKGDQARVATPEDAVRAGADYLVVGRPIREAPDPAAAARAIVESIRAAEAGGA